MFIEENKKIDRRYPEIINSKHLDSLNEVVSENLLTPRIMPGILSEIECAKAAHQIMLTGSPDHQTVIDDLMAGADQVAARVTMSGTHMDAPKL
jgi:predicted ester cyclase